MTLRIEVAIQYAIIVVIQNFCFVHAMSKWCSTRSFQSIFLNTNCLCNNFTLLNIRDAEKYCGNKRSKITMTHYGRNFFKNFHKQRQIYTMCIPSSEVALDYVRPTAVYFKQQLPRVRYIWHVAMCRPHVCRHPFTGVHVTQ